MLPAESGISIAANDKSVPENDKLVVCGRAFDQKIHQKCCHLVEFKTVPLKYEPQKINTSHHQSFNPHSKRKTILLNTAIIVLSLLLIATLTAGIGFLIMHIRGSSKGKSDPKLQLFERDEWNAINPKNESAKLELPVKKVIISQTKLKICLDHAGCCECVQRIQEVHMSTHRWNDVGFNFLISVDGIVFEGRGWDQQGQNDKKFFNDSILITFVGNYSEIQLSGKQVEAAQLLLEKGARLKKVHNLCVYKGEDAKCYRNMEHFSKE